MAMEYSTVYAYKAVKQSKDVEQMAGSQISTII